jgi:8-oxo-dGTP diphosphatase
VVFIAETALLDMFAQAPPFSLPRPRTATMITNTIMPQIIPYSMVVVPRVSRRIDLKIRFMALATLGILGDPLRLSRNGLKKVFKAEGLLQNFSTPVLVVAVALIDEAGRVLLQRRRLSGEHGGLWEFPGGKVEPGESPQTAILREIDEELGVAIEASQLVPLSFASDAQAPPPPRKAYVILLYTCRAWHGEAECREGEEIRWFAPDALDGLAMPPLDYPLAAALRLAI